MLDEATELGFTQEVLEQKAAQVEAALEANFRNDEHVHKTKFLQLLRNLRDEKNPQLRLRLMVRLVCIAHTHSVCLSRATFQVGHITADELVTMSATEMAAEVRV